jgi:succinate dehydrogenase flavin-adding protein (antitoxin of CptAB toxin-antitoxin module)
VKLEHRVILSPFAAKRLSQMLNKLVDEYETRYGELK